MATAERDGHQIFWEASGPESAPTLLLIMGLGLGARSWDQLPGRLSDRFRVITFDNRGTGRSSKKIGITGIHTFADDAAAVLRAAGVSEERPAFVFGISLGGMIAQELVLRHGKLVRALALGATNSGPRSSRFASVRAGLQFLALITLGAGKGARRLARLCISPGFHARSPAEFDRWAKGLDHAGPRASLAQLFAVLGHSTHKRLPALKLPTLIIGGDQDLIIPFENSRLLARLIPGAKLVVLEGAGHVFPLEQPQQTVDALVEHFLGR